jgi:hypothetical protein
MRSQGERLAHAIRVAGYKQRADFAAVAGVSPVTLRQQINRDSVPADAAALYARKLRRVGLTTDWLLFGKGPAPGQSPVRPDIAPDDGDRPTVPVQHFVGAGDEVHLFDDDARVDTTSAPPGYENGSAVIVRGDSMRPTFQPGDLLFFRQREEPPKKDTPLRAVIVQVTDGPLLLKKILPGTKRGLFHLISVNPTTPEMLDRHVDSIARIGWIKPSE